MPIRIDRVVTRGGDAGQTSLGNGDRVAKDDPRVEAYGTVDEANAFIGALRLHCATPLLARIQNDLFDIGADLCIPGPAGDKFRLTATPTQRLEDEITILNANLPPLTSFVLPYGNPAVVAAHIARTVTRRAERATIRLSHAEPVNPEVIRYLNRLSDYLFVLSRALATEEALWERTRPPSL